MKYRTEYDNKGYLVIRQFFSSAEILAVVEKVDRIYQQWLIENESDAVEYQLINMHSLTKSAYFEGMPGERISFFKAIAQKSLTSLIKNIFGEGLYFHNSQLFFNPYQGSRLPYWHRDIQYNPISEEIQKNELGNMLSLHVRVPLIAETGVELVPGTHSRWDTKLEKNVRMELNGHKNSEELPGAELIQLEAGDILIFSANMLHRGNYILNKTRKALDLCVGKQHPLTSKCLDLSVLPTDEEMLIIGNNEWYELARGIATTK